MRLPPKHIISVVLVILILLIAAFSFTGETSVLGGEPKADVTILYKPQIISAVYKVYGRPDLKFWLAKVIVKNVGTAPIRDLRISYSIEGYTGWSEPSKYDEVPPGGGVVDLYYPNLPKKIAEITSPTPSTLYIKIMYSKGGKTEEIVESRKIDILGLHDFVFSSLPPEENTGSFYDVFYNAPMIAAWVTPTDPVVREFSDLGNKLAGGAGATLSDQEAWNSMQGVWNALLIIGMTYKTEPQGYWTGKFAEYIKFPRDTILDGEGTCIDLAVMYASLMLAQGLKPYIVLIPGHAFPIIELPSGAWVPVETTVLNEKANFQQAVMTAVKNWEDKFSKGPYIIVDVVGRQAAGITPPELPSLPRDILERKGIKQKIEAYIQGGGQEIVGGGYGAPSGMEFKTYQNQVFSIDYPAGWDFSSGKDDEGNYVIWRSPDGDMDLYISWRRFFRSLDDYIAEIESLYEGVTEVNQQYMEFQGCPAALVGFNWMMQNEEWSSVDLFIVCNGLGLHATFEAQQSYWDDGTANRLAGYLLNSLSLKG